MRFSIDFSKALLVLLRHSFPIWGGISLLIILGGILLAELEDLSLGAGLYFAFVTGTTVGYGDLVPTSGASRLVAILIAILGILYTGIIVALALEAAKLSIRKNGSLDELRGSVEDRLDRHVGDRRRAPEE